MRIILYTGKGGVGKTSVAAATALRSARLGHRTVVVSTDAAHSLADSLDKQLSPEAVQVGPNLWAQETDIFFSLKAHWGVIQEWLSELLAWRGMPEIVADDMAVLPGMEELANLLYIVNYYEKGEYDTIVVDCAPTGETLRLLSFPEVLRWWMDKIFPLERKVATALRPIIKPLVGLPYPGEEVFDSVEHLFQSLRKMRGILADPSISSVRLVVNAEKMVIREAQRTFTYLNLYGYATDLVVCNRLIPVEVKDKYFDSWKESQGKYLQSIVEAFAPIPILSVPLFQSEVVGRKMLEAMGEALFGQEDPTSVFFKGQVQDIRHEEGHYALTLNLPFASKEDIGLTRSGDELVVQVGRFRRNVILPRALVDLPVSEAKFDEDRLLIRFEEKDGKGGKASRRRKR